MSTLLLAFANSSTNPLPTLTEEFDGVSDELRSKAVRGDFSIIADSNANRDRIIKNIRAYQNDISLFLFSGHAGPDQLSLTDGEADSDGIAGLLGKCKSLGLVILNGCSTAGQVKSLLDSSIPVVIATSAPVGDQKAAKFSISFFRELSKGISIREAFNHSLEETRVYGQIQNVEISSRGLVTGDEKSDQPLWGIYYTPGNEERLDSWRLPINATEANTADLNKEIKKALVAIARKYDISPSVNSVLERLPFTINEPIRNLFAIKAETQEDTRFYDTPSWERFQMIMYAYRSLINLTTYVLLAELWDEGLKGTTTSTLPDDCRKPIESTFFAEKKGDTQLSNLALLRQLGEALKQKQSPPFLTEINGLFEDMEKEILKKALEDLEARLIDQTDLKDSLQTEAAILRLCLDTEKSFSIVLFAFRFMVNYSLTSVKDIELLKYRYLKSQSYVHQVVPLTIGYMVSKSSDNQYSSALPLDTTSIIIHRHNENLPQFSLNLSPFLIDKNALIKSHKADLHYLLYFSAQQQVFCYRRANSYQEIWAIRPQKKMVSDEDAYFGMEEDEEDQETERPLDFFPLLKAQVESLVSTVMDKSADEL